jgi:1,2-dihydroxy-3-keto-5-methylthiopentene dioxygenase
VSVAALRALGVLSWHLPPDAPGTPARLAAIRAARGYTYADAIALRGAEAAPDAYAAKLKIFFAEHMHSDEEIRYITAGGGYFDVRAGVAPPADARWVRVATRAGDMIVLPAGIYHRFTPDAGDDVAATRLFVGEPVWTPIARGPEADAHPARAGYVAAVAAAAR